MEPERPRALTERDNNSPAVATNGQRQSTPSAAPKPCQRGLGHTFEAMDPAPASFFTRVARSSMVDPATADGRQPALSPASASLLANGPLAPLPVGSLGDAGLNPDRQVLYYNREGPELKKHKTSFGTHRPPRAPGAGGLGSAAAASGPVPASVAAAAATTTAAVSTDVGAGAGDSDSLGGFNSPGDPRCHAPRRRAARGG